MISADSLQTSQTLSELYKEAGLYQYPDWCAEILVTPSGSTEYRPRPYQVSGLNHLAAYLPRCAIYDSPGTGKSLQLQAFAIWMATLGNKPVCIMPPALVVQFHDSLLLTFQGITKHLKIGMLNGDRPIRQRQIESYNRSGWPDILLMSYPTFLGRQKAARRSLLTAKQEEELEALPPEESFAIRQQLSKLIIDKMLEEDKKHYWTPTAKITAYNLRGEALNHLGYNCLIADEAHKLKTPSSAIHKAVKDFVQPWEEDSSNGLVLATGSPIETNIEDAYGLISLLEPKRYNSMRAFDYRHCVLMPGVRYRKVLKYKNLEDLYIALYARGRRVTKKQAFPDMPVRVVTEVAVQLSKQHQTLYRQLVNEQIMEVGDTVIDATQQQRMYQYVQQILVCPERFTDKPIKNNALLDTLDGILDSLDGRKVLIFSWYQQSIAKLKAHCKAYNPVSINGAVTGTAREKAKNTFIEDDNCKVLIANPLSGGVGIDGWQKVCSYIIFVEVCPFPGAFEQAVGRLERSGQTETVNVYLLVPTGTISVKLRNDLIRKEGDANQAVRDKKTLLAEMLGNS